MQLTKRLIKAPSAAGGPDPAKAPFLSFTVRGKYDLVQDVPLHAGVREKGNEAQSQAPPTRRIRGPFPFPVASWRMN